MHRQFTFSHVFHIKLQFFANNILKSIERIKSKIEKYKITNKIIQNMNLELNMNYINKIIAKAHFKRSF